MKTIYMGDLAADLEPVLDVSNGFARQIIRAVVAELSRRLIEGDAISITGFGKFHCKKVGERTMRNPHTGLMDVHVLAGRCPAWKPSQILKAKIRSYHQDTKNTKNENREKGKSFS